MASTHMDENIIFAQLSFPVCMQTVSAMRSGAACMVMDAWDRNAIRGPFQEILVTAMPLNDNLSRLEIMMAVLKSYADGSLTEDNICETIRFLAGKADFYRKQALSHMEKLSECSEDDDPIH